MAGQGNRGGAVAESPRIAQEVTDRTVAALIEERAGYELKLGAAEDAADDGDEEAIKLHGSPSKWKRRMNACAESLEHLGYKGDEAKKVEIPKKASPASAK